MIDVTREALLTLAEASKLFPHRPSRCSLWRWITKGINGVRLRSVVCGGRRLIPASAIDEFIAACTANRDGQRPQRSNRQRDDAARSAMQECDRDGF